MSLPHHEPPRDDSAFRELFRQQMEGTAKRQWPKGRIAGSDDGEIAFMIGGDLDKHIVILEFPKEVRYVAMGPQEAIQFAQMLIKKAREVSKEPLRIVLH